MELELIEDSLADQVEHDAVLERLAAGSPRAGREPSSQTWSASIGNC